MSLTQTKKIKLQNLCDFKDGNQTIVKIGMNGKSYQIIGSHTGYDDTCYHDFNAMPFIIICMRNHIYPGFFVRYPSKVWMNTTCFAIYNKNPDVLNYDYLFYYLKGMEHRIYEQKRENTKQDLQTILKNLEIHVPSIEKQKEFLQKLVSSKAIDFVEKTLDQFLEQ